MLQRSQSVDITNWFKEQTKTEAQTAMAREIKKLLFTLRDRKKRDSMEQQLNSFQTLFQKYLSATDNEIDWSKISQVDESKMKLYSTLKDVPEDNIRDYLQRLAVVKLNGGLGTSMGCTGTKSLITVRSDLTFLDLTIRQIEHLNEKYDCNVPLVLMNSFNTHEETQRVLQKYQMVKVRILIFVQSMYPRINKESLLPFCSKIYDENADFKNNDNDAWYPPGHGDLYRSLQSSGILDTLLTDGIDWIFLSNIDNMGANVDIKILSFLMEPQSNNKKTPEFVMEVTDKTRADVKGGTLINYEDQLRLLEIAQVPKSRIDEFTSVRKFDIFNTNNLWINLEAIQRELMNSSLNMEIIVNHKILDNGITTIQLEEAAGAAIKSFDNAIGVRVPRSRFLPVKTTSDLLLVMSNLYTMKPNRLVMSPKRDFITVPIVKLGNHFKKVKDFLSRFENIPDLLELDHLTVSGDVTFGKNVTLKGTVIIIANFGDRINIPSGSILENKIVSGNLRILDH